MRIVQLSPRLQAVADLVPAGARLADVGTDHAYLPAYLLQQGRIRHAVVSDLRPGPLARARATAERYGLTEYMGFRLCDGLSGITPEEADTLVIAGMGGETISAILAAAPWAASGNCRLLLQPMSTQYQLRRWLQANGYAIPGEHLSQEGDSLYTILEVVPGPMEPMTPAQCWAGRQCQEGCTPLRGEYLRRLIAKAERILAGLRRSARCGDSPRLRGLESVLGELKQMLEEWNTWQP